MMKTTNFTAPKHGAVTYLTADELKAIKDHWKVDIKLAPLSVLSQLFTPPPAYAAGFPVTCWHHCRHICRYATAMSHPNRC